jgi:hypothetical protein
MEHVRERLRYQLITGADDVEFCRRVSAALDEGYELHGSPSMAFDGGHLVVAQAVLLPPYATGARPTQSAATAVPQSPTVTPQPAPPREDTILG